MKNQSTKLRGLQRAAIWLVAFLLALPAGLLLLVWLIGFDYSPYAGATPPLLELVPLALPFGGVGLAAAAYGAASRLVATRLPHRAALQTTLVIAAAVAGSFLAYFLTTFALLAWLGAANPAQLAYISAACPPAVLVPAAWWAWLLCSIGGSLSLLIVTWLAILGILAAHLDRKLRA